MPSLAQLTDAYQQPDSNFPVEPLYTAPIPANIPRVVIGPVDDRPEPIPTQSSDSVGTEEKPLLSKLKDKLLGTNGEERYQFWPEKVIREGLSATHDYMQPNPYPEGSEENLAFENLRQQALPEAALRASALAGTGGLAGTGAEAGAALGAGPFLRPALKYEGKIYKAPMRPDAQHLDALPTHLQDEFQRQAMSGEDISNFNFGFMNHKGQFLNREAALDYAIKEGLIDPHAAQYGVLTSTMMSDASKPGVAIEAAAKTAQPFYSAVEHQINAIPQAKMTGNQWLGTLSNKPGVKPEEMQWTGLQDFLKERGNQPVTKEEVQQHLANNKVELKEVNKGGLQNQHEELAKIEYGKSYDELGPFQQRSILRTLEENGINGETKYHSYQLPGGENYREMLLTTPTEMQKYNSFVSELRAKYGEGGLANKPLTEAEKVKLDKLQETAGDEGISPYKSSHWDEPNILAHIRMNDRNIEGKKSLHLEEIQSDWHQQGREKGYISSPNDIRKTEKVTTVKDADPLFRSGLKQVGFDLDKIANEKLYYYDHNGVGGYSLKEPATNDTIKSWLEGANGVPDAPFKKTWHELALKRMIREAAEKGYDRLSWTPGEAQAARYDLSKQVDSIWWSPEGHFLQASKNGHPVISKEGVTAEKLPDLIGKEAADRLINKPTKVSNLGKATRHELEGQDLKVGGEGMKGFYDQIIPKSVEKITGEKVKVGEIGSPYYGTGQSNVKIKIPIKHKVHYIDLPKSLKDKALQKGFPLFSGNYMFTPVAGNPFEGEKK